MLFHPDLTLIWTLFKVFVEMGVVIFKDILLEKNWSSTLIKIDCSLLLGAKLGWNFWVVQEKM